MVRAVVDYPLPDVREGVRRLTYAELADARGISKASAERLARRKGWARVLGNDGVVRVVVPPDAVGGGPPRKQLRKFAQLSSPDVPPLTAADMAAAIREAVTPLSAALARSEARADSLQAELAQANRRLVEVLTARIPWWRRWFR
jgi:hypothetical protein